MTDLEKARQEIGENCVSECCAGAAWDCDKCGDCASMWDAIARLEAAAREEGRNEDVTEEEAVARAKEQEQREAAARLAGRKEGLAEGRLIAGTRIESYGRGRLAGIEEVFKLLEGVELDFRIQRDLHALRDRLCREAEEKR